MEWGESSSVVASVVSKLLDFAAVKLAPVCGALLIGLTLGWLWRPGCINSIFEAVINSFHFATRRLRDNLSAALPCPVLKENICKLLGLRNDASVNPRTCTSENPNVQTKRESSNLAASVVGINDLRDLHLRLHGREGGLPWSLMMDKSAPGFTYKAWRRDPKDGPTEYKSSTIFEDCTPELVKDFYWDDEFRSVWDDMLIYAKSLEQCGKTGADIAHWVRKFPFFCSDREYVIGRRIFECDSIFYCITKAVPYAGVPRREKPLRVDIYYSSWCVRTARSPKTGQMTACEVFFYHAEDMHIPKKIAKFGVQLGMWDCVRKMEPGLRKYQQHRSSAKSLSLNAKLAQLYTKVPLEILDDAQSSLTTSNATTCNDDSKQEDNSRMKWLIIGGAVVLACTLDRGALGKGLVFGVARKFANLNRRL